MAGFAVGVSTGTWSTSSTGNLSKLTIKLDQPQLTPADQKRLMEAERNNRMSEYMLERLGEVREPKNLIDRET